MEPFVKRVVTVVVSLFLIAYVSFQAYQVLYNPVKTETVYGYSVYDTVDTEGVAIRNETLIEGQADGYLSYTIENGSRVAKDGQIAQVYPSEADSRAQQALDDLNAEIDQLRQIQSQGAAGRSNLDVIDKQLSSAVGKLTADVNSASIAEMSRWRAELLSLLNKRQITVGKVENFNDRIAALTERKTAMEASFTKATAQITSPVAGYFVSSTDGAEKTLTTENIASLSTEAIRSALSADSQPVSGAVGRVVGDYVWYFACIVPAESAGSLRQGATPTLVLPFVTNEAIPATVVAANRDTEGNVAVVFQCTYMSSELSSIRREQVQIRLERYEGLRVPSSCIIKNDKGEQGVYAVVGDAVAFRRVEILHSEPEFVICKETDEAGYLKMYDDIVVEGKGLYDGKTVR